MIEFLWSRVALTACGLAIMAVLAASFTSLDDSRRDRAALDGAAEFAELLEHFPSYGVGAAADVEASRFLPTPGHTLQVANGSVWTVHGDDRRAVEGPAGLLLLSHGEEVGALELSHGQSVRLENREVGGRVVVAVQLEKVSTMSSTAPTNLRHSASVL